MNKIYLNNIIVESIQGKINYYLPKHITNAFNFLKCINPLILSVGGILCIYISIFNY